MGEYKVWLAKLLTIIVIIMVVTPIVGGAMSAVSGSLGPKVAVIELSGVITDASEVLKALYSEARNKDTKAIVLRIDSPGGAVAPSEEIYNAVRRLKAEKPIVVSMGSMAASGGFIPPPRLVRSFVSPELRPALSVLLCRCRTSLLSPIR